VHDVRRDADAGVCDRDLELIRIADDLVVTVDVVQLEADLRASLASADVVYYGGHSGPWYAFSMANWNHVSEGEMSYAEPATIDLPADRYQVIVADGCDTYQIGEQLARNPNKPGGQNVDVITTTTFATAEQPYPAMNLLTYLTEAHPQGRHRPRTLKGLLRDLTVANPDDPLYGVHFVDDNPHLHPYGDVSALCAPCSSHDDCGAVGNRCVTVGSSGRRCATACTSDDACPTGYRCSMVTSATANAIYDHACVPTSERCR
jgi:hypothetical protein